MATSPRRYWLWLSLFCFTLCSGISNPARAQPYKHLQIASTYVGIREIHPNRSPEIDSWNRAVGAPLGSPYCASFVSHCLVRSGVHQPTIRTARSLGFVKAFTAYPIADVWHGKRRLEQGDIIIWKRAGGGHIGFVWEVGRQLNTSGNDAVRTLEANTSSGVRGSQWNGDGIWIRRRSVDPFGSFRMYYVVKVIYAR